MCGRRLVVVEHRGIHKHQVHESSRSFIVGRKPLIRLQTRQVVCEVSRICRHNIRLIRSTNTTYPKRIHGRLNSGR